MKYRGIVWAGILVEDLQSSISFYKDVLGLVLPGEGDDYAHFDAGDGALLELMSGGKAGREPKGADRQSIILGLRVDDMDSAIAELTQRGVQFMDEIGEFEGTRWAQFYDPEGNRLEIKEV